MKIKFTLSILLAFVVSSHLFGQDKFKLGVSAGATYSDIRGDLLTDQFEYDFGFLFGLSVERSLSDKVSLISNLNFERKKFENESPLFSSGSPIGLVRHVVRDYLTLPVMANAKFGKSKVLFVNGGVFIGYLLNAKFTSSDTDRKENVTHQINRTDGGLSIGFGLALPLEDTNKLNIELRDNIGLTGRYEKTNSISLIVGWSL